MAAAASDEKEAASAMDSSSLKIAWDGCYFHNALPS